MCAQPPYRARVAASLAIARKAFAYFQILLPPFARWTMADGDRAGPECDEVCDCVLAREVTDFGSKVSSMCDDLKDNFSFGDLTCFPRLVADAPRVHYLCNEYPAAAVGAART